MPMNQQINPNMLMQQIMQQMSQRQQSMPEQQPRPVLPQVTPEMTNRNRIAQALSAAGGTLASTPGDFMTGAAAGVNSGVGNYQGSKDDERNLLKEEQGDWDDRDAKRMAIMKSLLSGAGTMATNQRADASTVRADRGLANREANTLYNRGRDEKKDKLDQENLKYNRVRDALKDDQTRRTTQGKQEYKSGRDKVGDKLNTEKLVNSRYKSLGLDNEYLDEDRRKQLMKELNTYKKKLNTKQRKPKIGDTATGPNGQKIKFTAQGWVPVE